MPALVKALVVHPENPLEFDFIIDTGDTNLAGEALKAESTKLIKYFLASLTVPEDEVWVNLSPYEKDRIVPKEFGTTEMGKDLLGQDYILKQLTASLMYPESDLGQKFWQKIYAKAQQLYGTTNIPINTFNKVWIVPDKAVIYETGNTAIVAKSRLKVMLEGDYLALQNNLNNKTLGTDRLPSEEVTQMHDVSSDIVKEEILPEIEKEVNEGKTFANLRQIYNAQILAAWYKLTLKQSLLNQVYSDKNKVKGVDVKDKEIKQKIYEQYLEAFKKGVYNYIKEDTDQVTQKKIPRKYFSGGYNGNETTEILDHASLTSQPLEEQRAVEQDLADDPAVKVRLLEVTDGTDVSAVEESIIEENDRLPPVAGGAGLNPEWEQWVRNGEVERLLELWAKVQHPDAQVLKDEVVEMLQRLQQEGVTYAGEILERINAGIMGRGQRFVDVRRARLVVIADGLKSPESLPEIHRSLIAEEKFKDVSLSDVRNDYNRQRSAFYHHRNVRVGKGQDDAVNEIGKEDLGTPEGGPTALGEDLQNQVQAGKAATGRLDFNQVGGINLNPALLDLQIKRDGNGIPLPINQQPIGNMKIEGFIPVIINVTPVNLPLLLGVNEQKPSDSQPAQQSRIPPKDSMDLVYSSFLIDFRKRLN